MLEPTILADIDELFSDFHDAGTVPDIVHAVVHHGSVVHVVGRCNEPGRSAELTGDSVFRIASMTKSFTAAAVLLLRDEGRLTLDEPVTAYVPGLDAVSPATRDSPALTLRLLLTMSGGFPSDDPWADRQESLSPSAFAALLRDGLRFSSAPGTMFEYSNLGYAIAGRAIANVSGLSYHDFVRARLLDPLSMTSSHFAADDVDPARLVIGHRRIDDGWEPLPFDRPGEFSAIGGLYSTVNDLARWIGGFTDAFPPRDDADDDHPLCRSSRREMQQQQRYVGATIVAPEPPSAARTHGYGLGLDVVHDTRWGSIVGHSGGYPGFGSHMRWHPNTGFGVVALGNGRYTAARQPTAAALDLILGAVSAPRAPITPWEQTLAMRAEVQRLILDWDDHLADRIFAVNMDLDLPRDKRRVDTQRVIARLGTPDTVDAEATRSISGAHVTWSITGAGGRVDVEIWLTPHAAPKLHTLKLRFTPRGE